MNSLKESKTAVLPDFQPKEISKVLLYLQEKSSFYKKHFADNNINVSAINSYEDFQRIPTIGKTELQVNNWDFLCVPKRQIAEYCATSGTLGKPVVIALTENDLERLAENESRSFELTEVGEDDVIQLMLTLDRQFMAGIAYYSGARKTKAGIIRLGPGNIPMQFENILELRPTVLIAVPSFILQLIAYASQKGIDINSTSVKKIICIGENIRNNDFTLNALAQKIAADWRVRLFSTYASTEKQTAFTECKYGKGGHNQSDLLFFEVLNDEEQPVKAGELGELTITTIGVEGMPLLRYRTGDILCYFDEPCECGKPGKRVGPVMGRKNQLIKYNGTTLFPQTIFNVLDKFAEVENYVIKVSKSSIETDDLEILISVSVLVDSIDQKIRQSLQSALRVLPKVNYGSSSEIQKVQMQEGKRKPSKIVDLR